MDPNQTFNDMFEAMKNEDYKTARELALALKEWLGKGGFFPTRLAPVAVQACIACVIASTAGHGPEPIFTLVCRECDAGMHILTEEQALSEGWTEIGPAFALPQANYCGLCPDCRKEQDG